MQSQKVFVGGVPGYFSEADIKRVFGHLVKIRNIKLPIKEDGSNLNKGYCILSLKCQGDVAQLLKVGQIYVGNGRYVYCKQFLQGQVLQGEMIRNDMRRIVLKHVTTELTQDKIHEFFEQFFGPVELVFVYQPDEAEDRSTQRRRTCTASVTFEDQESVQKIFLQDKQTSMTLKVFGNLVTVERYKSQQLTHLNQTENLDSERGNTEREEQQKFQFLKKDNNYSMNPREVLEYSKHLKYETVQRGSEESVLNGKIKPRRHYNLNFGMVILDHCLKNLRFNIGAEGDQQDCEPIQPQLNWCFRPSSTAAATQEIDSPLQNPALDLAANRRCQNLKIEQASQGDYREFSRVIDPFSCKSLKNKHVGSTLGRKNKK